MSCEPGSLTYIRCNGLNVFKNVEEAITFNEFNETLVLSSREIALAFIIAKIQNYCLTLFSIENNKRIIIGWCHIHEFSASIHMNLCATSFKLT